MIIACLDDQRQLVRSIQPRPRIGEADTGHLGSVVRAVLR